MACFSATNAVLVSGMSGNDNRDRRWAAPLRSTLDLEDLDFLEEDDLLDSLFELIDKFSRYDFL